MSHRFKSKPLPTFYVPARVNRSEAELRKMAAMIPDQAHLESIIAQTGLKLPPAQREQMQRGCLERIRPFLKFKPAPLSIFTPVDAAPEPSPAETYCAEPVSGA